MTADQRPFLYGFVVVAAATTIAVALLATAPDNRRDRIQPATPPTHAVAWQPTQLPPPLTTQPDTVTAAVRGAVWQLTEPPPAPTTIPPDPCTEMHIYRVAAGLPERFDLIGYRESRCIADPSVRTWCCVGQSQLFVSLHLRDERLAPLYAVCGITSEYDVDGGEPDELAAHWCAVAAVFATVGYDAWSTT